MNNLPKNKKGVIEIIIFFLLLFTILVIGFIAVIAVSLGVYTSGIITPIMTDLGVIEGTSINLSQSSEYGFGTLDTVINALPWIIAFAYVAMLIFSVIFVIAWGYNPNPMFIGVYIMFVILLIFGCILISNIYEDIYKGTDEIAQGMQNQIAMSYMILYSPFIMTLIAFIVGIYIFAGKQAEIGGGYGV